MIQDVENDGHWIVDPQWAAREQIRSFAGQPLVFRGTSLGVLGVFSRSVLTEAQFECLRLFADQAAVALANSRAFAEIERLRDQLEVENASLKQEVAGVPGFTDILGTSPALVAALQQVSLVAPTDAGVLLSGESGVGKELFAQAVHLRSKRSDKPLVRVNCSAVPRDLFESEFFGHVRGAFTGALRDRLGRFQLADGGTLFLDEVSEIPLELQGKLLRAVQEGQFERVGDDRTRSVDVRVVAATNRDLRAEVAAGRFRQDLYFRLSVFPIEIPALRDRAEDIPLLAHHFIGAAARRLGVAPPGLSRAALKFLQGQRFPGNVRELQHSIERAVIAGQGKTLVFETSKSSDWPREPATESDSDNVLTDNQIRSLERRNLELALERSEHRIYGPQGAAELLGLRPTTLVSRLKALGLHRTTPSHRNGGLR